MSAVPTTRAAILGGAPPINPLSLSGLVLWLKADVGTFQDTALTTPAAADTDPVGGWQDQSGLSNHAVQATGANKPALKLAIQNGRPVLRGNGTTSVLVTPSITTGGPVTMFAVASVGAITAFGMAVSHGGQNELRLNGSTAKPQFNYANGAQSSTVSTVAVPSFHVWTGYYDGSLVGFLLDDVPAPTAAFGSTPQAATLGIFARAAATNFLSGDVAEVLYYNGFLTAAQQTQIYNYLKGRWATP